MSLAGTLPFSTPTEDPGVSNDIGDFFSFSFLEEERGESSAETGVWEEMGTRQWGRSWVCPWPGRRVGAEDG